ncbi:15729_t:CDS:2 [Cetraspora pellucida]|uniref:Translation machinery-associated protein 22 n=1 Tax=Cetraspora pellucida TaxID=1433469 RepID=A0A9N9N265_9GLOM|nr:15729_t:CDS:2 [Cetraspora pellucida]
MATPVSTAKQVIYCGSKDSYLLSFWRPSMNLNVSRLNATVCSLPPEYCEFGPTLDKCKKWLQEKQPEMFDKLYSERAYPEMSEQLAKTSLEDQKPNNDAEDKKKAKEAAKIERELQKKMSSKVIITRIARNKRKCVTNVFGLENFDIDLKKAAKSFATKFACGSSVVKNNQGNDEIVVQGDVSDDLFDFILETWPDVCIKNFAFNVGVPEDNIELTEEKKPKKG